MRIDIDENDMNRLDALKKKKWLGGKGHSQTIRYLLDEQERNSSIEQLLEKRFKELNDSLQDSVISAFKRFFSNLFGSENKT